MDDTWLDLSMVGLAFLIIHLGLSRQAKMDALHQAQSLFSGEGAVYVNIQPRGLFGFEANDLYSVTINTFHKTLDKIPFYAFPKTGWKGSIRRLQLNCHDLIMAGYPVSIFRAELPYVTYDLGYALYQGRLVLRGAGIGVGEVTLSAKDLHAFIAKKYIGLFSRFEVDVLPNAKVCVMGLLHFLGSELPVRILGQLVIDDSGSAIRLEEASICLNGKPLEAQSSKLLLSRINPVVDLNNDLGIGKFFFMTSLHTKDNFVVIKGACKLPIAPKDVAP